MSPHRISHVALHVESLRQAERFYERLFGLQALGRGEPPESGRPVPPAHSRRRGAGQEEITSHECLLGRGQFRLLLRGDAAEMSADSRLAHIAVRLPAADLEALACRAISLGCRVAQEAGGPLILNDVYGVEWHVLPGG